MEPATREALVAALPVLRGHYCHGAVRPQLSWQAGAALSGIEIDLAAAPEALSGRLPEALPVSLWDPERGVGITLGAEPQPAIAAGAMTGRIVAVTGAASGIGRAVAEVFAGAGARVAGLDIDTGGLDSLAADTGALAVPCDITDPAAAEAAFAEVVLAHGGLDILVSNAGAAFQSPIADAPLETLRRSFDLNFFGHQIACQTAIGIFRRQGRGGLILFNISNQSINPGRNFGPYGIPKAATLALMRQYALDHGSEGIRVNGVNAGRIRTGLLNEAVIAERAQARGVTPQAYMSGNLIGAEVTACDVAEAFLHLAQMPKVNAAVLTVDGGAMETCLR